MKILKLSLILLLTATNSSIWGQTNNSDRLPMLGFGFVSSFPGAPVGFSIIAPFKNKSFGIYGEVKARFVNNNPEGTDYTNQLTRSEIENGFGDAYLGERKSDLILANVGVMFKAKTQPLYYSIGVGIKSQDSFRQYFDDDQILDITGNYYIADGVSSGVNINGSLFYLFKSGLYLQGGLDTNPLGINMGLGFILSWYR